MSTSTRTDSTGVTVLEAFEDFMRLHLSAREAGGGTAGAASRSLFESVRYSLFSGGKRFRPQVAFAVAQMLGLAEARVYPLAAAIEFIHTYSLIHDDLPCMDDDDVRRGKPTNHRVYGEATALLAGDALLTEAFELLASGYVGAPEIGLELVRLLSEAAGLIGMVAGQARDMAMQDISKSLAASTATAATATMGGPSAPDLLKMLSLKTGALIRISVEGVAVVASAPTHERKNLRELGALIGLAFQLADDLLDYDPAAVEPSGLPAIVGVEATREKLAETSEAAAALLRPFGARAEPLRKLISLNLDRKI